MDVAFLSYKNWVFWYFINQWKCNTSGQNNSWHQNWRSKLEVPVIKARSALYVQLKLSWLRSRLSWVITHPQAKILNHINQTLWDITAISTPLFNQTMASTCSHTYHVGVWNFVGTLDLRFCKLCNLNLKENTIFNKSVKLNSIYCDIRYIFLTNTISKIKYLNNGSMTTLQRLVT